MGVAGLIVLGWGYFVATAPNFEYAKPGSPAYVAWDKALVDDCVHEAKLKQSQASDQEFPMTLKERVEVCLQISRKMRELWGIRPPRVRVTD